MTKCGKFPCYCDQEKIYIPFMGEDGFIADEFQLAAFIRKEDRIPIVLGASLYSKPRNDLSPELIPTSVTPRTAAWIYDKTIIIGLRGTCAQCAGGFSDLADDKVSLLHNRLIYTITAIWGPPAFLINGLLDMHVVEFEDDFLERKHLGIQVAQQFGKV